VETPPVPQQRDARLGGAHLGQGADYEVVVADLDHIGDQATQ
jgi:hypothetical protein